MIQSRSHFAATIISIFIASQAVAMGPSAPKAPLNTVENVNLELYLGKWYEIARLPQIFEKNCVGSTAIYTVKSDDKIRVENTCRKNTCSGKTETAIGTAKNVDSVNHSKLKVSFFWPFQGDYWILKLGATYNYAVVGSPDRKSLWILSRNSTLDASLIDEIKTEFAAKGFNTAALEFPPACE